MKSAKYRVTFLGAVVPQNFKWALNDHDLFEDFNAVDHLAGAHCDG